MHFVSPLAWACMIMHILYWIATYLFEKHLDPSSMQDDIVFDPGCSAMWLVWFGVVPAKNTPTAYFAISYRNNIQLYELQSGFEQRLRMLMWCSVFLFFWKRHCRNHRQSWPQLPQTLVSLKRFDFCRALIRRVTPLRIFEKMLQMASEAKLGKEELVADRLVEP